MKIAYFSSVLNHHQIEFCDYMYALYGDDFTFVSTMDIEEQRIKLGYKLFERDYNLKMHTSEDNRKKGEQLFMDADVVILGVFLEELMIKRLKKGKITFLHKERLFKEKPSLYWKLRCQLFIMRDYFPYRFKPFYMMAASAYSYKDFTSLGMFKNKTFAWGYFPPVKAYDIDTLMAKKECDCINILWAGRLIDWKHPDYALEVASTLKNENVNFHMNIIGNGDMEADLRKKADSLGLDDFVTFTGSMPPEAVREYMEKANIYLFTSDRAEGFGAVVTEAMNSGCALIASETAGATNLLVRDKENGRIYHNDSAAELCDIVTDLVGKPALIRSLGKQAYKTITEVQNAKIAAQRFSDVAEAMVNGKTIPVYTYGPMMKIKK